MKYKFKTAIYFLVYIMVLGAFIIWSAKYVKDSWIIKASEEELQRPELVLYRESTEENGELEVELEAYKAKYPDPKREEIEAYVRLIFGRDANTALAISHHECGYTNKNYPKCSLKTSAENSIGLFQINLHNERQWIHAKRIPGVTMEEKKIWLENPFNNALYAYWVKSTSGWFPWSAFTSGAYLNDPLMK